MIYDVNDYFLNSINRYSSLYGFNLSKENICEVKELLSGFNLIPYSIKYNKEKSIIYFYLDSNNSSIDFLQSYFDINGVFNLTFTIKDHNYFKYKLEFKSNKLNLSLINELEDDNLCTGGIYYYNVEKTLTLNTKYKNYYIINTYKKYYDIETLKDIKSNNKDYVSIISGNDKNLSLLGYKRDSILEGKEDIYSYSITNNFNYTLKNLDYKSTLEFMNKFDRKSMNSVTLKLK